MEWVRFFELCLQRDPLPAAVELQPGQEWAAQQGGWHHSPGPGNKPAVVPGKRDVME